MATRGTQTLFTKTRAWSVGILKVHSHSSTCKQGCQYAHKTGDTARTPLLTVPARHNSSTCGRPHASGGHICYRAKTNGQYHRGFPDCGGFQPCGIGPMVCSVRQRDGDVPAYCPGKGSARWRTAKSRKAKVVRSCRRYVSFLQVAVKAPEASRAARCHAPPPYSQVRGIPRHRYFARQAIGEKTKLHAGAASPRQAKRLPRNGLAAPREPVCAIYVLAASGQKSGRYRQLLSGFNCASMKRRDAPEIGICPAPVRSRHETLVHLPVPPISGQRCRGLLKGEYVGCR